MEKIICTSCKTDISTVPRSTFFKCPGCGNSKIVRCGKCRVLSTKFRCPDCSFEGP